MPIEQPNYAAVTLPRDQIPTAFTWNLQDLYPTEADWQTDADWIAAAPNLVAPFVGTLGKDGQTLLAWMRLCDEISLRAESMVGYAFRISDSDTADGHYQALRGKAMRVLVELRGAMSFAEPEIMALSDAQLDGFYAQVPDLHLYRRAIDESRRLKAHVLSPAEEKILAAASEMAATPESIGERFRDADLTFADAIDAQGKAHALTQGSFIPLMQSSDRTLRQSAFASLYGAFAGFRNTTAAILDGQIKQQRFFAQTRKFDNTLQASLANTNVPESVYHSLLTAVEAHLPTMHRYMALRQKLMDVDTLHMYDIYTPLVPDSRENYTYDQACAVCMQALAPMGQDYCDLLQTAFDSRWIDVYENKGKRSGAYSSGARPHPYVLLNHKDTLDCTFTIAHEMGHALHSYLSMQNQPVPYSDYVIFVAEVASTCNEVLLMQHLLAKATDRRARASLINYFLEQFRTTVYRQTMFAEFELLMNQKSEAGETLTADLLDEIYYDLNVKYYGTEMEVDRAIAGEWARIPHFFYNFYVFQYATGFSAAIALAMQILKEGEPAAQRMLRFLSGGCSADPITLLQQAGCDLSTPAPVEQALTMFAELVNEMEGLMADE